jgi:hypothetical protein
MESQLKKKNILTGKNCNLANTKNGVVMYVNLKIES